MPRTLDEIDPSKPVHLTNYRHDLDRPMTEYIKDCPIIVLPPEEGGLLLTWVRQTRWKGLIEADLQSLCQDSQTGEPFLTAWVPLVCFREEICSGGRQMQDAPTIALMTKLRDLTRNWRDLGGDTVFIDGYQLTLPASRDPNELFIDITSTHIRQLPNSEWVKFRQLCTGPRPPAPPDEDKPDPSVPPHELAREAMSEDGMSLNELIQSFPNNITIGSIEGQPVYYFIEQGIYAWGQNPATPTILTIWLTYPAYPPGW